MWTSAASPNGKLLAWAKTAPRKSATRGDDAVWLTVGVTRTKTGTHTVQIDSEFKGEWVQLAWTATSDMLAVVTSQWTRLYTHSPEQGLWLAVHDEEDPPDLRRATYARLCRDADICNLTVGCPGKSVDLEFIYEADGRLVWCRTLRQETPNCLWTSTNGFTIAECVARSGSERHGPAVVSCRSFDESWTSTYTLSTFYAQAEQWQPPTWRCVNEYMSNLWLMLSLNPAAKRVLVVVFDKRLSMTTRGCATTYLEFEINVDNADKAWWLSDDGWFAVGVQQLDHYAIYQYRCMWSDPDRKCLKSMTLMHSPRKFPGVRHCASLNGLFDVAFFDANDQISITRL
jgi:hypothetical protein